MTGLSITHSTHAVVQVLGSYRYRFSSEKQLHEGISQALERSHIGFIHEHKASESCRFDFWIPDSGVVIEAKIDGSFATAIRQAHRYLEIPECKAVIIAATKQWATISLPVELRGKPIEFVRLMPQAF